MAILLQRLCWNSNGWRWPSGEKYQTEDSYVGENGFGHEEWNLNTADLIDGRVYGYTYYNPPPSGTISLGPHDIFFFAIAPNRSRLLVGAYRDAYFLTPEQRGELKNRIEGSDYLDRRVAELLALHLPQLRSEQEARRLLLADFPLNVGAEPEHILALTPPRVLRRSDTGGRDPRRLNRYTKPVFLESAPQFGGDQENGPAAQPSDNESLVEDAYVRFTPAQRRVIVRRHNLLSNRFRTWLESVKATNVAVESNSIDISCVFRRQSCLFELKTCYGQSVRHALRDALGQLLEYALYPGRAAFDKLAVVLDTAPGTNDIRWFQRLVAIGLSVELFWLVGENVRAADVFDHPLTSKARQP